MDGRGRLCSFHILAIDPVAQRRVKTLTVTCLPLEPFCLPLTSQTGGTGP